MEIDIIGVSEVIQLAVAPVFLLAGISGTLSVLTVRLGRIVDRGRKLDEELVDADNVKQDKIYFELRQLSYRGRLTNWAIKLSTACALLICMVIAILFVSSFLEVNLSVFVAFVFVSAMTCLMAALLLFLKEVELSTSAFHFGDEKGK